MNYMTVIRESGLYRVITSYYNCINVGDRLTPNTVFDLQKNGYTVFGSNGFTW